MRHTVLTLALATLAFSGATPAAAGLRCGQELVSIGDSSVELLLACGEPLIREFIGVHKTESKEVFIERWTYHFGSGTFLVFVTLEAGLIAEFTDGARQ